MTPAAAPDQPEPSVLYAVDPYIDQIRVKQAREYCPIMKRERYAYFDTEQEAKDFIIYRVEAKVLKARDELALLEKRLKRIRRKYG